MMKYESKIIRQNQGFFTKQIYLAPQIKQQAKIFNFTLNTGQKFLTFSTKAAHTFTYNLINIQECIQKKCVITCTKVYGYEGLEQQFSFQLILANNLNIQQNTMNT